MKIDFFNLNEFTIYLNNDYIKSINLDLENNAEENFKKLLDRLKKIYNLNLYGYYKVIVYTNKHYGIIIEMNREDDDYIKIFGESIDLKILFKYDSKIFYEVDTFNKYDVGNINIYYYNNKFYIEVLEIKNNSEYLRLLEDSKIIYGTNLETILNNVIQI